MLGGRWVNRWYWGGFFLVMRWVGCLMVLWEIWGVFMGYNSRRDVLIKAKNHEFVLMTRIV